jgi:4'-phosphopantetheinyl transferase EntD
MAAVMPGLSVAEMYADAPAATMYPAEAAVVRAASPERRREFGTVRHCARTALRGIGVPAGPVLPDPDRAPRWPAGVVGSMTHCPGYRAAVVARSDRHPRVGIDAEPHHTLPIETLDLVLRDEERELLAALVDARPGMHWDRIAFCAKEAVYKAWFPLTREWLDFTDVAVSLHADGSFEAVVLDHHYFSGRWLVGRGLVLTGCAA